MNFTRISTLSRLVTNDLTRKPTIVLDPNQSHPFRISGTAADINTVIDTDTWVVPREIKDFIAKLSNSNLSTEQRILALYSKICKSYTYDDNVLSYVRKIDDETFFLPDNYGRTIDVEWKTNREKHNRRNCFEISRILAKSLAEMMRISGKNANYDVCILWDEAVTHYLVGLASNDYHLSLDTDDFTQIKDLTRLKTELTAKGIHILYDPQQIFTPVLRNFNAGKCEYAQDQVRLEQVKPARHGRILNSYSEDVQFIQYAIHLLKDNYDLDPAGMFEYIKEIVDTRMGTRARKKIWKEVGDPNGTGTRYTRCLIVTIDDIPYIIDVTKDRPNEIFRQITEKELASTKIKPGNFTRTWEDDPYDGR